MKTLFRNKVNTLNQGNIYITKDVYQFNIAEIIRKLSFIQY